MKKHLLLITAMLFSMASTFAQGGTTGPLTWNLNGGTLTISGTGVMPDYEWDEVPWGEYQETIHTIVIGTGVTTIGNNAFASCTSLALITIPNSVAAIGFAAFSGCHSLTSITIPNSVTTLGDWAFSGSGLTSITIPSSVATIGNRVFVGCNSLTLIDVENGNSAYASESGVLFDKSKTILICYPMGKIGVYVIPSSVTTVGYYAFAWCESLSSITIPNSVIIIGSNAFYGCTSLSSITIPNGVTTIENSAFGGCTNLTSITIPSSVTTIGYYVFQGSSSLLSITIPSSVTTIGYWAFEGCTSLTSIDVESENSTYASENGILFDKSKITLFCYPAGKTENTYVIPSNVTTIGNGAFAYCINLISITFPSSITTIGGDAFVYCSGLTEITSYPTNPPTIYNAFKGVNKSIPVLIDCSSLTAYNTADYWKEFTNWRDFNNSPCDVGVAENVDMSNLIIHPNPTTGELKIESNGLRIENIIIYDIFGKVQKIVNWKAANGIDISHLSSGVYFVKISTKAGEVIKKVLKE